MRRLSQISSENINSEATKSRYGLKNYPKKMVKRNMTICKLDSTSLHDSFSNDASFAGILDLSSQIGGTVLLKDE
jgi:hypothetical protein